ncbi:MAG TPA: IS4 family transposase [Aminivibrio sp.]|nr:IS4 family transposase [Aminivibrio sp.]
MLKPASLFSQILSEIFTAVNFDNLVAKWGAERHAKGFRSKTQLISMLFCHLAGADSLREIVGGLSCCNGKLVHLGIKEPPRRSTLSYANNHRKAELFEELFWRLSDHFRSTGSMGCRKKKFRFKNKLLSFDSTTISLCLSLFPWAEFRRTKGGVKVHVLLDHDDYMPSFVSITEAKTHDSRMSKELVLKPGSIVALDRGYVDFGQFRAWTDQGVFFVTRMKDNCVYSVDKVRPLPENGHVLSDEIVRLTGTGMEEKYPEPLRRITAENPETGETIVLLTNHLRFAASTIGEIYRDRWEIELFFKTLKQNLKVKTFVGESENALRIQIWTALISLLVIKWLHHLSKAGWSFSNMATMLRLNLFTYRALRAWLDEPYETPPIVPEAEQLKFSL